MKISELVKQLEDLKQLHGDIDVKVWPYDGQMNGCDVKNIFVQNKSYHMYTDVVKEIDPYVLIDSDG